jgi:hypothetical protein
MGVLAMLDHQMAPLLYTSTSSRPYVAIVDSTSFWTLVKSRTSTDIAVAFPPADVISRATVLIVELDEFGSGGKGEHLVASDVVFAATTTVGQLFISMYLEVKTWMSSVSHQHIRLSQDR